VDSRSRRVIGLVKHKFAGLGIAQDEVAGYVRRPVAPVVSDVGSPVAAVGEAPDGGGFRLDVSGYSRMFLAASLEKVSARIRKVVDVFLSVMVVTLPVPARKSCISQNSPISS